MDAGVNGSGDEAERPARRRTARRRILAAGAGAAAVVIGIAWSERGDIADHAIGSYLREKGVAARWRVESVGLGQQVLTDVVVGDPAHPDLTIERVVTTIGLNGGTPGLDAVTLVNPRLHGIWQGGRVSFGSLDKLLGGPSTAPFRLPDLALRLENGRGQIVGDAGVIGLGLTGSGPLRDGFAGALAVVARHIQLADCGAADVKLSGTLSIAAERPRLTGPLRLADLRCSGSGVQLTSATLPLDLRATAALDGGEGHIGWAVRELSLRGARAASVGGDATVTLRGSAIAARYAASAHAVQGGGLTAAKLTGDGWLRADTAFAHVAAEGTLGGSGLTPGAATWRGISQARRASANTLAEPLLTRIAAVLARETPGSRLSGRYILRRSGANGSLFLPEAQLTGGSGAELLSVTRGAVLSGSAGLQVAGQFKTGGQLPLIAGAIMRDGGGRDHLRLTITNYQVGSAAAAVPHLDMMLEKGALAMTGTAVLSGALPGGATQNLRLPIAGSWTRQGLKLWPGCTRLAFDRLGLATLTLVNDALTMCPGSGGAIVRIGGQGVSIAAGIPTFDLAGQFGGAPIHLSGGPLGVALLPGRPGTLVGNGVAVTLGEGQGGTSHFRVDSVTARLGSTIDGHVAGSDIELAAVPLNLRGLGGDWRYDGGVLTLSDASFHVEDREPAPRFQLLVARGATLTLAKGVISAQALLREPRSDRAITAVAIRHDLGGGSGHADLAVDGIVFDKGLQPEALSPLVLGVVADVRGIVTGQGSIDWAAGHVTSQGSFASDSLDFAAAFGPVKGVSGAISFTDLLGLVSAPDQQLKIAAINPGVEVDDGVASFALLPGHVLAVNGAEWPFLDGRLRLLPTRMTLGASEVRRLEMRVEGVDVAKFLVRMNMSNLTATGVVDGSLPLVFDQNGGKVVGGLLASRPPGGSVSYVGALSYKDLSPMANYAFETLKSLKFTQLSVGLDGSLSGDIFTRVSMRGVTQGPGARRNFLTRQIGRLPLQFNVNIHAPFYMLVTNFKSLYDSSYLPDPRTLGLLGADGRPVAPPSGSTPAVQPPVIETRP